jgi:hypothetical protein
VLHDLRLTYYALLDTSAETSSNEIGSEVKSVLYESQFDVYGFASLAEIFKWAADIGVNVTLCS